MEGTYQQTFDGISTINFAYAQDDIIFYPIDQGKNSFGQRPDLWLKPGIIFSHRKENKGTFLTMEEAEKLVNPNLEILSSRMAVIPTEGKRERLCYEFKGTLGEKRFIVYIDANTGEEADILQIIDTGNGSLTI